jgi:3-oxoacyl-[acyl-carrier-protein] synthase II
MGAAGALELAGNLPSLQDGVVHPCLNLDTPDPECEIRGIVTDKPIERKGGVKVICDNSFGMLGINSTLIVKRYDG